jgi:hypothetical protein
MNTSEFELTAKIEVSVPETIEVFGEKVTPQYESDEDGDWIEYSGCVRGNVFSDDEDDTTETSWDIHIELDGEGLYVRATVDDTIIHEEASRMHCGLDYRRSHDTMARYVRLVGEMVDVVVRTKLMVKK